MICFPNAKINLGLNIVQRRPDGYHNIETVFYPIKLTDALEIVQADEVSLTCYGNAVNCPVEKNLVMKAYRLLQQEFNLPPVAIFLHKNIPDGAGLGGGSSDAASTLTMLNEIFSLNLTNEQLATRAASLGADCAFFIYNKPMMATGIGNVFSPIDTNLTGKTLFLVKPDVSVPTVAAYSRVTPHKADADLRKVISAPIAQWKGALKNDFEASVFAQYPELGEIKHQIEQAGASYAAMSGSGSSIFGIFENAKLAEPLQQLYSNIKNYTIEL